MAVAMPGPEEMPPGPLRELLEALHELYRAAGKPGTRVLSAAIRERDDLRDTVSHETINAMLRGGLARWVKLECVVRQLAAWSVGRPEPDEEVRRFHALWLAASDSPAPAPPPPRQVRHDFVADPPLRPHGRPQRATEAVASGSATAMIDSKPNRNARFVGRDALLAALRQSLVDANGRPVVLYGVGGVGKTQLALEYAHRWVAEYDIVWWIPAEHPAHARTALAALAERLDLLASQDMRHTAQAVLEALESSSLRWLLVYDNADVPAELGPELPASAGHAIVTTRNADWGSVGLVIDVDVFVREESVALLCGSGRDISPDEADRLAERLGDLPLALDQVAVMQAATGMAVSEYLRLYANHLSDLLASGPPALYPAGVATVITVAFERLRSESMAAAQLLELFAHLGPEPVPVSLLRSGRDAQVSQPLGRALAQPDALDRAVRQLGRFGLARIDLAGQQIQVHRLVQIVLRDSLDEASLQQARTDVHQLLAAANPGNPDDPRTWGLHREIGPHAIPADLIHSTDEAVRQVVLDQIRYLYKIGHFHEGERLARIALTVWSATREEGGLDANHDQVLTLTHHLGNLLRALGNYAESARLTSEALNRLRRSTRYGADHPHTLAMASSVAVDLRVTGDYRRALEIDRDIVNRLHGAEDRSTMEAAANLAVSLRMTGDFAGAYETDSRLVAWARQHLGEDDPRTLLWISNLARDLYGLGRYAEALRTQRPGWATQLARLGLRHPEVLMAGRTIAIALRKIGDHDEALRAVQENYRECHGFLGPDHEHTLAAVMSYANTLRVAGDPVGARSLATEALARYRRVFGPRNPLTLAAASNLAVILRSLGERGEAREVDRVTHDELRQVLGDEHPFTLAAAVGLASDLAASHESAAALALSERTLEALRRICGDHHPDTIGCAVNLAHDLEGTGDLAGAGRMRRSTVDALPEIFGSRPAATLEVIGSRRYECDIEPPPT